MEIDIDPNSQEYKEVEQGFLTCDPRGAVK